MQNDFNKRTQLQLTNLSLCYFVYIVLLYVFLTFFLTKNTSSPMQTISFALDFNFTKYIVSIFLVLTMWYCVVTKYHKMRSFSEQVILLIILLYFIPGVALSGIRNFEWSYIILYYLYFLALVFFDSILAYPKREFPQLKEITRNWISKLVVVISFASIVFLVWYYGRSFSWSLLLETLIDPYSSRMAAREAQTPWAIMFIEYWASYFCCYMISRSFRKKQYILAGAYVVCELILFTLRGNRSYVFYAIFGVLLGFSNINKKKIALVMPLIMALPIIEFFVINNNTELGPITNILRRYSVDPNILGTQYFEYFSVHPHDWLKGTFSSISNFFGFESQYGMNVGYIIGKAYYGWSMYANTGLFGGAYYEFGISGIFIDTLLIIVSLRIFEKVLYKVDNSLKFTVAFVYSLLVINTTAVWANCFRITPILIYLISLYVMCGNDD